MVWASAREGTEKAGERADVVGREWAGVSVRRIIDWDGWEGGREVEAAVLASWALYTEENAWT